MKQETLAKVGFKAQKARETRNEPRCAGEEERHLYQDFSWVKQRHTAQAGGQTPGGRVKLFRFSEEERDGPNCGKSSLHQSP